MKEASDKGTPPMRPLFYDFPQDANAWDVDDQYMFGPDLLLAPILHEGARSWKVYLPSGTGWMNAYTGERLEGGLTLNVEALWNRFLYSCEKE